MLSVEQAGLYLIQRAAGEYNLVDAGINVLQQAGFRKSAILTYDDKDLFSERHSLSESPSEERKAVRIFSLKEESEQEKLLRKVKILLDSSDVIDSLLIPTTYRIQINEVPYFAEIFLQTHELGNTISVPLAVPLDRDARDDLLLSLLEELNLLAQRHNIPIYVPHNPATFQSPGERFNKRLEVLAMKAG